MYNLLGKACYILQNICIKLAFYFMFKGNKFSLRGRKSR